ncbi:MAG: hypothetical protein P8M72_10970 [Gammaproteobacteria bacterium]|nr:hypothetical protein [Gammaproteobacteria bacterium]
MRDFDIKDYINHLPIVGLIAPPLIYLFFFGINSSAFSALGMSGDNMLLSVLIISLLIWGWSALYARSVNKFLKKQEKDNFKLVFGINSFAWFPGLIFWFSFDSLGMSNIFLAIGFLLIFIFILDNFVRVWLTSIAFDLEIKTSLNANKFVLIIETIAYLPYALFSMTLGGAFI